MSVFALADDLTGSVLGGRAFSPRKLFAAGEQGVWYDPSDLTTLFTDTAGTTRVTAPGQEVALMLDKSGRGNHAVQSVLAARPIYAVVPRTGRRNLLTYTEQFDNGVWTKNSISVTANADGVADNLIPTATSARHAVIPATNSSFIGLTFAAQIKAKANGYEWIALGDNPSSGGGLQRVCFFNVSSGSVGATQGAGVTGSISGPDANGFYTCRVVFTASTGACGVLVSNANNTTSFTGDGVSGALVKEIQLELGSTATAYQRVVTQHDVSEAGVEALHYLSFDGTDDGMVTGTITPGVDKVQVFAGVRKLSDAVVQVAVEFSANISNSGSFNLAPSYLGSGSNVGAVWTATARGTAGATTYLVSGTNYAAPATAVNTMIADISADSRSLRINGATEIVTSAADFGTGNFLAYPLYLGSRGGTTLPFNGHIYGLIVRFGATNLGAAQIANAERWLARKTGVVLP